MARKKLPKFHCFVNGINMDSYITDGFRCFLANFGITLFNIDFGYICIGVLILIIAISLFGGIKEHYRWFILNQAVWDLMLSYDFICHNLAAEYVLSVPSACVYYWEGDYFIGSFFYHLVPSNTYGALLLLSFTRFLCLFFMNFYDKLTRNRRLLYLIVFFNVFMILTTSNALWEYLALAMEDSW